MTDSFPSPRKKATRTAAAGGAVLTLGAALVAQAPPAGAAPFTVTNDDDDGAGSLRVAIESANAAGGADSITFAPGLGPITLTTGEIEITDELTITGPAIVSGNNDSRIFRIAYADEVTITGLTLVDAEAASGGAILVADTAFNLVQSSITGSDATDGPGGALRMYEDAVGDTPLSIVDSNISGNTATGDGGGVYVHLDDDEGTSPITVSGSTFHDNESGGRGGGFSAVHNYDVSIDTTTFSGNTADAGGGGANLQAEGGSLEITSSTVSGNTSNGNASENDGGGGGLRIYGFDYLDIAHTTIAGGNEAVYGGGVWITDVYEGLIDHTVIGGNVADDFPDLGLYDNDSEDSITVVNSLITANDDVGPDSYVDGGGNVVGEDPGLEALADNGGPNQTMAVTETSAAFNAGDPAFAPPPDGDQRGLPRVQFEVIDIGAYEAQPAEEPVEEPRGEPPAAQPTEAAPNFTG